MGTQRSGRLRLGSALGPSALAALALVAGGCGGSSGEATADDETSGRPEAEDVPAVTEVSKPAKPEVLRLLEGGNPTVFVRLGETLKLHASPDGEVVKEVGHATEFGSRTVFAVTEQRGDWAAVLTPYTENGEPLWVELDPQVIRAGRSQWDIEVDLSEFKATLYLDGEVERQFDVSVGTPTAPTPTGRFAVTDTFRGDLNEAYGCCAIATTARQANLPSGWLGGDRIAIHGTTGPLRAEVSHGCVRAADTDVSALVDVVPPGTPVEIRQ